MNNDDNDNDNDDNDDGHFVAATNKGDQLLGKATNESRCRDFASNGLLLSHFNPVLIFFHLLLTTHFAVARSIQPLMSAQSCFLTGTWHPSGLNY